MRLIYGENTVRFMGKSMEDATTRTKKFRLTSEIYKAYTTRTEKFRFTSENYKAYACNCRLCKIFYHSFQALMLITFSL